MNFVRYIKVICLISSAVCFAGCGDSYGDFLNDPDNAGEAQWATPIKTVSEFGSSYFFGVAVDDSGNTYAVGQVTGGSFGFGGNSSLFETIHNSSVIVKYNSSGVAQWATKPVLVPNACAFSSVAVDTQGNAYAAGYVDSIGEFDFGGNSGKFTGKNASHTAVIVKYNSSGVAQWATQVYSLNDGSQFKSIALDAQGNIYAAGTINGTSPVDFGGGIDPISGKGGSTSSVIVKYNSSGVAQWARTVSTSAGSTQFKGVAADKSGNIYTVGYVAGIGDYDFVGGSDTGFTTVNVFSHAVIVKYDSSGAAQWAAPIKVSTSASEFDGVAVDRSGNIFTVGSVGGSGTFDFGGNSASFTGKGSFCNSIIVKYNSSGVAQWASPVDTSSELSSFNGVSVDVLGNAYAVGYVFNTGSFYFGGNSSPINGKAVETNSVIVKYNEFGAAQWAKTVNAVEGVGAACEFTGVAVDCSGYSYAVGTLTNPGVFDFGGKSQPSPSGSGTGHYNTIIVKFY